MYTNVGARIKIDNHLSKEFCVRNGTKQGCNFSPSLFNLYINDLFNIINKNNNITVRFDRFLNVLLYGDDIVLLSESRKGLQQMLNFKCILFEMEFKYKYEQNQIVIFNSRKHFQFTLGSKVTCNSNHFTYLYIEIKRDGSFSSGIQNLVTKANRAYFSGTPLNILVKLYFSTVKPILLYSSEIWFAYLPQLQMSELFKLFMNNKFGFEN